MWSFNNWGIIPGALLMPQCVSAAHQTVPPDFHVHTAQTNFLANGTVTKPATYRVGNLNDGKTFATRQVKVEQDDKTIAVTTVGFTKRASAAGRGTAIAEHAVKVRMPLGTPRDECDDIKYIRGDCDPTVKGYALPIVAQGASYAGTFSEYPPNPFRSLPKRRLKTREALAPCRRPHLGCRRQHGKPPRPHRTVRYLPPRLGASHLRTGIRIQDREVPEGADGEGSQGHDDNQSYYPYR